MSRNFAKRERTINECFRKSQIWRSLSQKTNVDNFENRSVVVGGIGVTSKEEHGNIGTSAEDRNQETEDLQVDFVGNTIKSSKYTKWTFIPR